jgi:hypothetical protein
MDIIMDMDGENESNTKLISISQYKLLANKHHYIIFMKRHFIYLKVRINKIQTQLHGYYT